MERAAALLATLYANVHTKDGGYSIYDFMPHDSGKAITLEQALESWA